MTLSVKIICDSKYAGNRLTTMELTYPRFIHAEFMTHRVFSRNASSSRAIPIQKLIDLIKEDTAMPIHWGKNQPGMQAHEELSPDEIQAAKGIWLAARDEAIAAAEALIKIGAHKQIVNRILEPFSHITVLVTADSWNNFFALRDHTDAQPEICVLAQMMKDAMDKNVPYTLADSDMWHLPYIDEQDVEDATKHCMKGRITRDMPRKHEIDQVLCAISAARCARVSYLTHDKKRPTIEEDMNLFFRLTAVNPPHMSPCEHQAHPTTGNSNVREGNFRRWHQFRHTIHGNTVYDS